MLIPGIGQFIPFSCSHNHMTLSKLPISNHPWSILTPKNPYQSMKWSGAKLHQGPKDYSDNLLEQVSVPGTSLTSVYFTRSPSGFTCSFSCPGSVQFPKTTSSRQGECKEQWISCTHFIACSKQIKADCFNDVNIPGLSELHM